MKTSKLRDLIKETIKENFDKELAKKMGMSPEEFEDQVASRDIGSSFPGTDKVSDGYKAARALIDELRYVTYKKLSDDERDAFTKEMVGHFIETTQGMAAAKVAMARKGL
jgi:hypothetical protein